MKDEQLLLKLERQGAEDQDAMVKATGVHRVALRDFIESPLHNPLEPDMLAKVAGWFLGHWSRTNLDEWIYRPPGETEQATMSAKAPVQTHYTDEVYEAGVGRVGPTPIRGPVMPPDMGSSIAERQAAADARKDPWNTKAAKAKPSILNRLTPGKAMSMQQAQASIGTFNP